MEYFLTFKTQDNTIVNHIVNEYDNLTKCDYIKNAGEDYSDNIIDLNNKKYVVVKDTLPFDSKTLMKYLCNNFDNKLNLEITRIMLYFMDPRLENIVEANVHNIVENQYCEKINELLYDHFQHLFHDVMIIRDLRFQEQLKKFVEDKIYYLDDYQGQILNFVPNEPNTYIEKYKNRIIISILKYNRERFNYWLRIHRSIDVFTLSNEQNKDLDNRIIIKYPISYGKASQLIMYVYEKNNYNVFHKIKKININSNISQNVTHDSVLGDICVIKFLLPFSPNNETFFSLSIDFP